MALRIQGLDVATPDGARKLIGIDRFAIAAGDKVALLGVNGAGKSTFLTALAAAYDPKQQHYDGLAAGTVQSGDTAGLLRPGDERPAAGRSRSSGI